MNLKKITSLVLVFLLLIGSFVTAACGDSKVRTNIVAVVTGVRQVAQALSLQLPPDDPKYVKVVHVKEAADRFLAAFDTAQTNEDKVKLVPLLADLVSGFSSAVLPFTDMGGGVALAIVAADTSLRFLAAYFSTQISRYEKLLTKEERELAVKYKKQFDEFLGTQTVREVIAWQSQNNLRQPLTSE